jgi:hypothetical protein
MATKKKANGNSVPTQLGVELVVSALAPVTISAPDTKELVTKYNNEIRPLATYVVRSNEDYLEAQKAWMQAREWHDTVATELDPACDLAFRTHRALTGFRGMLQAPAVQVIEHMDQQIKAWSRKVEQERLAEEARLQREADEQHRRDVEAAEAAAKAQRELDAAMDDLFGDDEAPEEPETQVEVYIPPPPEPIRIPSSLPVMVGGPKLADLPWTAVLENFDDLVLAAAERLKNGDRSLMEFIAFDEVAANKKAREIGADLHLVIPGVKSHRPQTLKRS